MTDNDETAWIILAGLWLWSQYTAAGGPVMMLQQGGAKAYDVLHSDAAHRQDLPRPERMTSAKISRLKALATAAGFPDPTLAAAIAMAESTGNPKAYNKTYREESIGLWQINIKVHPQYTRAWLENPENNARAAYLVSKQGRNWSPWRAYTNGTYRKYVP